MKDQFMCLHSRTDRPKKLVILATANFDENTPGVKCEFCFKSGHGVGNFIQIKNQYLQFVMRRGHQYG